MLALERHVGHFQEEEIKKIFDKDYYEKYAAHVPIFKTANELLYKDIPVKTKINSQTNSLSKLVKNCSLNKVILTKFDTSRQLILKGKQETERMHNLVKMIDLKLKEPVVKVQAMIRTFSEPKQIKKQTLQALTHLDNQEYAEEIKKRPKKEQFVRFFSKHNKNVLGNIAKVEEKLPFNSNKKVEREIKRKRSLSEATVNNMLWDKMLQIKEDFWAQNERKVLEKQLRDSQRQFILNMSRGMKKLLKLQDSLDVSETKRNRVQKQSAIRQISTDKSEMRDLIVETQSVQKIASMIILQNRFTAPQLFKPRAK